MSYKIPVWHAHQAIFTHRAPSSLYHWLTDQRSLTRLLTQASNQQFRVEVLNEGWQAPFADEPGAGTGLAFVREVILYCSGKPTVYARTVIPRNSLTGELRGLTRLGNRPLGAVLFANPLYRRVNLEIAAIKSGTALHKQARKHTNNPTKSALWGRRSVFLLHQYPLLVNEIFLNDMSDLQLPGKHKSK